jgi:hypothetical protein
VPEEPASGRSAPRVSQSMPGNSRHTHRNGEDQMTNSRIVVPPYGSASVRSSGTATMQSPSLWLRHRENSVHRPHSIAWSKTGLKSPIRAQIVFKTKANWNGSRTDSARGNGLPGALTRQNGRTSKVSNQISRTVPTIRDINSDGS